MVCTPVDAWLLTEASVGRAFAGGVFPVASHTYSGMIPKSASFRLKGTKKPAEIQRVTVVLGGVEPPTHGFSVHCSTT